MEYLLTEIDEKGTTRFDLLLAESKLKDIMVGLGITTEKVLLMEGQPTQIVGHAESKKLDELMPALLAEVKRRGVTVKLTERKAEIDVTKE